MTLRFRPFSLIVILFSLVYAANSALELSYGVEGTVYLKHYYSGQFFGHFFLVAFHPHTTKHFFPLHATLK